MKKRVMTVDDEPDVTYLLTACIEETGLFQVDLYIGPILALVKFKPSTLDLVNLDIRVPCDEWLSIISKVKIDRL